MCTLQSIHFPAKFGIVNQQIFLVFSEHQCIDMFDAALRWISMDYLG